MSKSNRDQMNDRFVAIFHEMYPQAAQQIWERHSALIGDLSETDAATKRIAGLIDALPICSDGKKGVAEIVSEITGKKVVFSNGFAAALDGDYEWLQSQMP